ncbi:hypothetical protein C8R43DRAFT_1240129, partial [Mycena crocata]
MLPLLFALPTLVTVALVASFSALDTDDSFQLRDVDCYGEDCLITMKSFLDGLEASPTYYEDWWRQVLGHPPLPKDDVYFHNPVTAFYSEAKQRVSCLRRRVSVVQGAGTSTGDASTMHDFSRSLPNTCDAFSSLMAKSTPSNTCDANTHLEIRTARDYFVFAAFLCALAAALLSIPFVGVAGCLSHIFLIVRTDLEYIVGSLMPPPADAVLAVIPPPAETVLEVADVEAPTPPAVVADIDFLVQALVVASFGSLAALIVAACTVELSKRAELDEVITTAANPTEDVDLVASDAPAADDLPANDDIENANAGNVENVLDVAAPSETTTDVEAVTAEPAADTIQSTNIPDIVPGDIKVERDVVLPVAVQRDVVIPVEEPEPLPRASARVRTHTAPGQLLLVPGPPLPAGAALPRVLPLPPLRLPTIGDSTPTPNTAPAATRASLPSDVIWATTGFPMAMAQRPIAPEPVPAPLPPADIILGYGRIPGIDGSASHCSAPAAPPPPYAPPAPHLGRPASHFKAAQHGPPAKPRRPLPPAYPPSPTWRPRLHRRASAAEPYAWRVPAVESDKRLTLRLPRRSVPILHPAHQSVATVASAPFISRILRQITNRLKSINSKPPPPVSRGGAAGRPVLFASMPEHRVQTCLVVSGWNRRSVRGVGGRPHSSRCLDQHRRRASLIWVVVATRLWRFHPALEMRATRTWRRLSIRWTGCKQHNI